MKIAELNELTQSIKRYLSEQLNVKRWDTTWDSIHDELMVWVVYHSGYSKLIRCTTFEEFEKKFII